jgi:hypothetical protein
MAAAECGFKLIKKALFNEKWLKNRVSRSSGTPCLYLVFYLFFSERQPDRTVT